MSDLRSRIIRLAHANPELRSDLLPLLGRQAAPEGTSRRAALRGLPWNGPPLSSSGLSVLDGLKDAVDKLARQHRLYGQRVAVSWVRKPNPLGAFYVTIQLPDTPESRKAFAKALSGYKHQAVKEYIDSRRPRDEAPRVEMSTTVLLTERHIRQDYRGEDSRGRSRIEQYLRNLRL
jgi:hypothetical protein